MCKDDWRDHIRLCEHCIGAIYSRGEKVLNLGSLYFCEHYADYDEDAQGLLTCEWCEDEIPMDSLYDCVIR